MKLSMYTDMEKNLFMFMPEDISDEEIVNLGEICFPEIEAKAKKTYLKPTGYVDLINLHALYSVNEISTDLNIFSMQDFAAFDFSDDFLNLSDFNPAGL